MAAAIVGALVVGGGLTGGAAVGMIAAATLADMAMQRRSMPTPQQMDPESRAQQIDRTVLQERAEPGRLQLGADPEEDLRRRRGKDKFKVELDPDRDTSDTGLQLPREEMGAQL